MDFKAENFPLYILLLQNGTPEAKKLAGFFELARTGDDLDRYAFAQGMQALAQLGRMPDQTEELNGKTLEACLAVFEEQGVRHAQSAFMAGYNRLHGLGCAPDPAAGKRWLDKAGELSAEGRMRKSLEDFNREVKAIRVIADEKPFKSKRKRRWNNPYWPRP